MKHSWKNKLDARGLEFVELSSKLHHVKQPTGLNADEVRRWVKDQKAIFSSYPKSDELGEKRKVKLDPRFVELLVKTDPDCELSKEEMQQAFENESWPLLRAEHLEMHQRIALMLEADQMLRFQLYAALAFIIVFFQKMVSRAFKKQFGTKEFSWFKMTTAVARHIKWIGDSFRGEVKPEPGRVNLELAGLVDAILRFQREPLTQLELYEAVKAAGGKVPEDPEAFRLWLHRARKDGLVTKFRSTRAPSDK
jgi:hypothetical protein